MSDSYVPISAITSGRKLHTSATAPDESLDPGQDLLRCLLRSLHGVFRRWRRSRAHKGRFKSCGRKSPYNPFRLSRPPEDSKDMDLYPPLRQTQGPIPRHGPPQRPCLPRLQCPRRPIASVGYPEAGESLIRQIAQQRLLVGLHLNQLVRGV